MEQAHLPFNRALKIPLRLMGQFLRCHILNEWAISSLKRICTFKVYALWISRLTGLRRSLSWYVRLFSGIFGNRLNPGKCLKGATLLFKEARLRLKLLFVQVFSGWRSSFAIEIEITAIVTIGDGAGAPEFSIYAIENHWITRQIMIAAQPSQRRTPSHRRLLASCGASIQHRKPALSKPRKFCWN